jgi:Tfp pilus assembly protein PilX
MNAMNAMHIPSSGSSQRQRGAVTLFVALVLLLGGTIMAFFANRGFIFEQRTSVNQYRSTKAFELAEAGAEWALGKLNEGLSLSTAAGSCATVAGTSPTFLDRYANPQAPSGANLTSWFNLAGASASFAGCRFDPANAATNGGWTCACPAGAAATALGSAGQGRFGVRLLAVAGDTSAIEIVSRGCSNLAAAGDVCDPAAATPTTGDATAVVRVVVKVRATIGGGPAAALTTGTTTNAGGNLNVVNTYTPSNGITIHAGGTVQTGSGTNAYTLPGTPARASILDNDPTLSNLTLASEDQFFAKFFNGQTLTEYRQPGSGTRIISGCSPQACGQQIMDVIDTGERDLHFYVDGDVQFQGSVVGSSVTGSIGTSTNPVTVVAGGAMDMQGTITAHGLFYSATPTATTVANPGGGTATIFGAYISRGAFQKQGSGTFNIVYTPSLWGPGQPISRLVRVPGTWRDKLTEY